MAQCSFTHSNMPNDEWERKILRKKIVITDLQFAPHQIALSIFNGEMGGVSTRYPNVIQCWWWLMMVCDGLCWTAGACSVCVCVYATKTISIVFMWNLSARLNIQYFKRDFSLNLCSFIIFLSSSLFFRVHVSIHKDVTFDSQAFFTMLIIRFVFTLNNRFRPTIRSLHIEITLIPNNLEKLSMSDL